VHNSLQIDESIRKQRCGKRGKRNTLISRILEEMGQAGRVEGTVLYFSREKITDIMAEGAEST